MLQKDEKMCGFYSVFPTNGQLSFCYVLIAYINGDNVKITGLSSAFFWLDVLLCEFFRLKSSRVLFYAVFAKCDTQFAHTVS